MSVRRRATPAIGVMRETGRNVACALNLNQKSLFTAEGRRDYAEIVIDSSALPLSLSVSAKQPFASVITAKQRAASRQRNRLFDRDTNSNARDELAL